MAGVLWVEWLSMTMWTSSSFGTDLSMSTRNFLNSMARCWGGELVGDLPSGELEGGIEVDGSVSLVVVVVTLALLGAAGRSVGCDRALAPGSSHRHKEPRGGQEGTGRARRSVSYTHLTL